MKTFKRVLIGILILAIGVAAYFYWGTYSEGTRSGIVVKISHKGFIFKTWEGQMNLLTFGAVQSPNMVSESFEFSVSSDQEKVLRDLEAASLSGERVSLHYVERLAVFRWRGDTRYFVVRVERQEEN